MNRREEERLAVMLWLKDKGVSVWPTGSWDLTDADELEACQEWWFRQLEDFLDKSGYQLESFPLPNPFDKWDRKEYDPHRVDL